MNLKTRDRSEDKVQVKQKRQKRKDKKTEVPTNHCTKSQNSYNTDKTQVS